MINHIINEDLNELILIENMLLNDNWSKKMFVSEINNNNSLCIKYYYKSQILGYIICNFIIDELNILKLVVHPLYRQKKIGSNLLNHIINNIFNIKILYLEVRAKNKIAINFYKKNKFSQLYVRKNYYIKPNDDAIIMCFNGKEII